MQQQQQQLQPQHQFPPCPLHHYSATAALTAPKDYPFLYTPSSNSAFTQTTSLSSLLTSSTLPSNVTVQNSDSLSTLPYSVNLKDHLNKSYHHETSSYLFGYTYSPSWLSYLSSYVPPTFLDTGPNDWSTLTPSLGFSGSGYGVQFHTHGPVVSEVFLGDKTWFLYPPGFKPSGDISL
eukprot:CAMPEP_0182502824 /NCGR_PEP_ID=MMETSP1321-20130603/14149_1 /TAXON_ID=91990 /ORGANISM="Bolidomonas sp., Strain RCC1657" /LENGTH=177 /DNA_ID=CAMNT_0024707847 /DNA_START=86 /DNA_END=616 /DNA_ORIENTATION=+